MCETVGLHRVHDVGDLVRDGLQCRAARWAGVVPAVTPAMRPVADRSQWGAPNPENAGTKETPPSSATAHRELGQEGAPGGVGRSAQGGRHPVQGGPGGDDVALAGVGRGPVDVPGHGRRDPGGAGRRSPVGLITELPVP